MRFGGDGSDRPEGATSHRYDPAVDGHPAVTVARTVAEHRDVASLDLPPLGRAVAPDALSDLLSDVDGRGLRMTFTYAGCDVVVRGDGFVAVTDRSPGPGTAGRESA